MMDFAIGGGWWMVALLLVSASVRSTSGVAILNITTTTPPAVTSGQRNSRILDTADLDLNRDGCISGPKELEGFKRQVVDALDGDVNSVLRAHSIVHRSDINRDGRICWCDFILIFMYQKDERSRNTVPFSVVPDSAMFKQLDLNKDGALSGDEKTSLEQEFESCLLHGQAAELVQKMADLRDKDDRISLNEFEEFFNILKEPAPTTSSN